MLGGQTRPVLPPSFFRGDAAGGEARFRLFSFDSAALPVADCSVSLSLESGVFRKRAEERPAESPTKERDEMPDMKRLQDAILNGDAKASVAVTREALDEGLDAGDLVTQYMIPAMDEVGR